MYTVSIIARNKEHIAEFSTEREALAYANAYWHLSPLVRDPSGMHISPASPCSASEY